MSEPIASVASDGAKIKDVGFAKLRGEKFQFFMQTYEMILGCDTEKGKVDLDLSIIGGGKDISCHHARIFYDFKKHVFFLQVLGKSGCTVQGTFYLPGDDPVKLKSQDLIQIGELKFYFLLPRRSIFETLAAQHANVPSQPPSSSVTHPAHVPSQPPSSSIMPPAHVPSKTPSSSVTRPAHIPPKKKSSSVKRPARIPPKKSSSSIMPPARVPSQPPSSSIMPPAHIPRQTHIPSEPLSSSVMQPAHPQFSDGDNGTRVDTATQVDNVNNSTNKDTGNQQLQLKEEEDIISRVATLISDNCAPGQWMPVEKLHSELIDHFGKIWPRSKVQKHLITEGGPSTETMRKPWYNLLELLKKHSEHFVISTITRATATLEFVSLESLLVQKDEM